MLLLLCLGFLHGLGYLILQPAWEHYDEPGHFEYAWMAAQNKGQLAPGGFDNEIRARIQKSMVATGFFHRRGMSVPPAAVGEPIWIGIPQVGDPPVYYVLAGTILRLLAGFSTETMLLGGRLFSLFLFPVVIWMAWLVGGLWFPQPRWRWLLPFAVAALPALADLMSALNNDSLAIAFLSVYLYFALRALKTGLTLPSAILLLLFSAASYFIKASVWICLGLTPLLFILSLRKPLLRWGILLLALAGIVVAVFQWGDAALWLRNTWQTSPTLLPGQGNPALHLVSQPGRHQEVSQALPSASLSQIAGQPVTLQALAWTNAPCTFSPLRLQVIHTNQAITTLSLPPQALGPQPQPLTAVLQVPAGARRVVVTASIPPECNTSLQLDDIALLPGDGAAGTPNLLRNAAGDAAWPFLDHRVIQFLARVDPRLPDGFQWMIYSLDFSGNLSLYKQVAQTLLNSFWARFGWGQIGLLDGRLYYLLAAFSLLALAGLAFSGLRARRHLPLPLIVWVAALLLLSGGFAWFTSVSMGSLTGRAFLPVARFIFPAVILIQGIHVAGLRGLARLGDDRLEKVSGILFAGAMILLVFWSFFSVRAYYVSVLN